MRYLVIVMAAVLALVTHPAEAYVVRGDMGGSVAQYQAAIDAARQTGEKIAVDGACMSACALVLQLPRDQICATPNAEFGFHNAFAVGEGGKPARVDEWGWPVPNKQVTADIVAKYPPAIKKWIAGHGGMHPWALILKGDELRKFVPSCR